MLSVWNESDIVSVIVVSTRSNSTLYYYWQASIRVTYTHVVIWTGPTLKSKPLLPSLSRHLQIPSSAVCFSPCRRSPDHTLSLLTSSLTSSLTSTSTSHSPAPPAMFTVAVDGSLSERAAVTCVSFVGSVEPVMVKVTLPLDDLHHCKSFTLAQYLS